MIVADPLRKAYQYCEWITTHHYENFPVASWLLPKSKRPQVAAIYAFARSADDFSDEAKYQGRGLKLLNAWRTALWACSGADSKTYCSTEGVPTTHPIFLALGDTIRRCHLPVQLCDDLLSAFLMDVTKRRYANWQELLTYCRYSANPVGRLVLTIFGYQDPRLHQLSDCICTGLQLANHWQDLRIDFFKKDRLYIPQDLMEQHGVREDHLKECEIHPPSDALGSLMSELVRRARDLFDEGEPLLSQVSGRLRLELTLTLLGGRAILDQMALAHYDVFRHRPVLSTWAKLTLLSHALVS